MRLAVVLLLCLSLWIPDAISEDLSPPEDQDASGDDLEISGSGSGDGAFVELNTEVVVKSNTMTPIARRLKTSPLPATAASTPASKTGSEPSVSQSPSTRASTAATRDVAAAPGDREAEPKNPEARVTSASPAAGGRHTAPMSGKADPKEEAAEPTTLSPAVVDVTMKESPEAPEKHHIPAAPTFPIPATTVPSWANPDVASSTLVGSTDNDLAKLGRRNEFVVPEVATGVGAEGDSDIVLDPDFEKPDMRGTPEGVAENQSLLERKEVLAGVVAGGIVGLAFAIMLVSLMVYRMKKKDEGSYALDEQKHPNSGYQKPQRQEEFLA
ncbi:hypothetical protein GN956_G18962 [Arapaima gigas]